MDRLLGQKITIEEIELPSVGKLVGGFALLLQLETDQFQRQETSVSRKFRTSCDSDMMLFSDHIS